MTYDEALRHLRRILSRSPQIDRDALEAVVAGPPRAAREEVALSGRDPRVEDPDAIPTDALRALADAGRAAETAGEASVMAGRAVQTSARALAQIEVQRERRRRSSATMPAVRPEGSEKP